jgi:HTH-type transcriptional regulator / antitoxin HipB
MSTHDHAHSEGNARTGVLYGIFQHDRAEMTDLALPTSGTLDTMLDRADTEVARAVRARRKQLGLRQQDLAELAGVATRSVHAIETGKPTIRLDVLEAIAHVLGLTLTLVPSEREHDAGSP